MGSLFTREAVIALLKKLFVNWWKSKGKTLANDEWGKIVDLVNEKVSEVVGPRDGYLITTQNGSVYEIKVDNDGIIYTSVVVKHIGQPVPPSPEFRR